jgi:hypothetical protein
MRFYKTHGKKYLCREFPEGRTANKNLCRALMSKRTAKNASRPIILTRPISTGPTAHLVYIWAPPPLLTLTPPLFLTLLPRHSTDGGRQGGLPAPLTPTPSPLPSAPSPRRSCPVPAEEATAAHAGAPGRAGGGGSGGPCRSTWPRRRRRWRPVTPDFRRGTKCISYVRQDQFTHI